MLIEGLFRERVEPGGMVVIGDVAFADATSLVAVQEAPGVSWDPSEHYFVADSFLAEVEARGITGNFRPISFCAGVFALRRGSDAGS